MRVIAFISLAVLLSSCGARYHLKRAQAHLKKAEELGASWKSDTVYVEKTVLVPEVRVDTIVQSKVGDTIRIEKEKLRIKYVKLPGDSVYVEGKCLPDTIFIKTPVSVKTEIKAPPSKYRLLHIIGGSIIGLVVGLILGFVFGKVS